MQHGRIPIDQVDPGELVIGGKIIFGSSVIFEQSSLPAVEASEVQAVLEDRAEVLRAEAAKSGYTLRWLPRESSWFLRGNDERGDPDYWLEWVFRIEHVAPEVLRIVPPPADPQRPNVDEAALGALVVFLIAVALVAVGLSQTNRVLTFFETCADFVPAPGSFGAAAIEAADDAGTIGKRFLTFGIVALLVGAAVWLLPRGSGKVLVRNA